MTFLASHYILVDYFDCGLAPLGYDFLNLMK